MEKEQKKSGINEGTHMIIEPFAMRLCGFLFLFILVTNVVSVVLGNKMDEYDSVAKLRMINDNRINSEIASSWLSYLM